MKKVLSLVFALILLLTCFQAVAEESKSLIIYFDYSENIDTTGLDVDAITQASMAGTIARDRGNLLDEGHSHPTHQRGCILPAGGQALCTRFCGYDVSGTG